MIDIKKRAQGLQANSEARDITRLVENNGNIYESLVVIAKRAKAISAQLKEELHGKLEEFATSSENLEEIHENKEQIEISKFYERLPNPALIATEEFLTGKLAYRNRDEKDNDEDDD